MNASPRTSPAPAVLEPLMGIKAVLAFLSMEERAFQRLRASGKFPKPDCHVGSRKAKRWRPETIRAWIAEGGCK